MEYYGMAKDIVPQMLELVSRGEGFWLTVTGYSMTPTLRHMQDQVYISPYDGNAKKGDILLTRYSNENCLLHRVVKRKGNMLYYRGDALHYCEGPIPASHVIGIVTRVKRQGKIYKVNTLYTLKNGVFFRVWHLKNRLKKTIHYITKK